MKSGQITNFFSKKPRRLLWLLLALFLLAGVVKISRLAGLPEALFPAKAQDSPDAIGIRVIPNPEHYSARQWYEKQGFSGSPQSITVDGYEGIRDGRTVYVNVANIDDRGTANPSDDQFYTNIYLISYSQAAEKATVDIFGQILSHWKFNVNVGDYGRCSISSFKCFSDSDCQQGYACGPDRKCHLPESKNCSLDSDCPLGFYCDSQKAKIIRDTKRLADLTEIQAALDSYQERYQRFPVLAAGTYLPNKTISVWPSWQKTLAQELGVGFLPVDPINQLGDCGAERFDPKTCWDFNRQEFAGEVPNNMPAGSRFYAYQSIEKLQYVLCAQLETEYGNIDAFKCYAERAVNHAPRFINVSLRGAVKNEFSGYVRARDEDGDLITYGLELVNPPDPSTWTNVYHWQWDPGQNGFTLSPSPLGEEWRQIHAAQAGDISGTPDQYQIRITLNDGRGEPNSAVSQVFNVAISGYPIELNSIAGGEVIIGQSESFFFTGTDASRNPIAQIYFQDASFHSASEERQFSSEAELAAVGFSLSGTTISEFFTPGQRTGNYLINIYAQDPVTGRRKESFLAVTIKNNPPILDGIEAHYRDGTTEACRPPECSFHFDNNDSQSYVRVAVREVDPGHNVNYELVDNFGVLTINANGEIRGWEGLNFHHTESASFNVRVRAYDQYCSNSSPEECSIEFSFPVEINNWCTVNTAEAGYINAIHAGPYSFSFTDGGGGDGIDDLMGEVGLPAPNSCSEVGNETADIVSSGSSISKAILFVFDTSGSMDGRFLSPGGTEECRLAQHCCYNYDPFLCSSYNNQDEACDYYNSENCILTSGCRLAGSCCYNYDPFLCSSYNNQDEACDYHSTYCVSTLGCRLAGSCCRDYDRSSCSFPGFFPSYDNQNEACDDRNLYCVLTEENRPINIAKEALLEVIDTIRSTASDLPPEVTIEVGLIPFSGWVHNEVGLGSIALDSQYDSLRAVIENLSANGDTNTLAALNEAEREMESSNAENKNIVLISDGVPRVTQTTCREACYNSDCPYCPCSEPCPVPGEPCPHSGGGGSGAFNDQADFKIAITARTECLNSHCPHPSVLDCSNNEYCQTHTCFCSKDYNCSIANDTATEAEALKDLGYNLYTIFYDTGGESNARNMCFWSSEEEGGCDGCPDSPCGGQYAFSGNDIEEMINEVLANILTKPEAVAVSGREVPFTYDPHTLEERIEGWDGLEGLLDCSNPNVRLEAVFENSGAVRIENFTFDYCPPLLHPY